MKTASVRTTITKSAALDAIMEMTVLDPHFDPDPWSIYEAERLEQAAHFIRREIEAKTTKFVEADRA